jgi:hypothetical protein
VFCVVLEQRFIPVIIVSSFLFPYALLPIPCLASFSGYYSTCLRWSMPAWRWSTVVSNGHPAGVVGVRGGGCYLHSPSACA